MLLRLAWRNILRNARRSLLTAGGICFCTAFVLVAMTHLTGVLSSFEEDLLISTGHIRLVQREYVRKQRLMSLRWAVPGAVDLASRLRAIGGVEEVLERITFGVAVDTDGEHQYGGVCVAIDPSQRGERQRLEHALVKGGLDGFGGQAPGKVKRVVVGKAMARKMGGVAPGSTLTLIVRTRTACLGAGVFRVVGVVDLEAHQLNRLLFVPLQDVREMLEMEDRATEILVFATGSWGLDELAETIRTVASDASIVVQPWYEVGIVGSALDTAYLVIGIIFGVIMVVAGIGVGNTMVMAVLERTREIGVLGAMGFRTRQIVALFLIEGFLLGLIGTIPGLGLGIGGSWILETHGMDVKTEWVEEIDLPIRDTFYGKLTTDSLIRAGVLGLLVAVLASVGPALRAARLEPARALRR